MKRVLICAMLIVLGALVAGCAPQVVTVEVPVEVTREVRVTEPPIEATRIVEVLRQATPVDREQTVRSIFPQSLHATTRGQAYFYSKAQGGFEQLTGLAYDQLACRNCHALYNQVPGQIDQPRCESCHIDRDYQKAPPQNAVKLPYFPDDGRDQGCLACHTRQGYEIRATTTDGQPAITDIHRSPPPLGRGMQCANCHTQQDTHGDGRLYNSMFESPSVQCEDCHRPADLPSNIAHLTHGQNMACDACHVQTVVACTNCHLNTVVPDSQGRVGEAFPYDRTYGWKFLIKRDGKIDVGNLMTLVYTEGDQAKTFAVIAPFHDHSVRSLKGEDLNRVCGQCHSNANVTEYQQTGSITISQWDDRRQQLIFPARDAVVVPVPMDYATAFKIDFAYIANLDEVRAAPPAEQEALADWEFAKSGVDLWQMLYAEPLDRLPPQINFTFPTPTPRP